MHPKRFFLLLFIVALAVTAVLAIAVILIGKPNEMETKILLSTMSIGAYSLIALCCATAYSDPDLKLLSVFGIAACGLGLTFALLTNWQILRPEFGNILRWRVAFLSVPMALAATTLMARISGLSDIVQLTRAGTVVMVWITVLLLNLLVFDQNAFGGNVTMLIKLLAVTSILGVLGLIATPVLKKVFPA